MLLFQNAFTLKHFNSEMPLISKYFYSKMALLRNAFTLKHFYSKMLFLKNTFTPKCLYSKMLLFQNDFTPKCFYSKMLLLQNAFTPKCFYSEALRINDNPCCMLVHFVINFTIDISTNSNHTSLQSILECNLI